MFDTNTLEMDFVQFKFQEIHTADLDELVEVSIVTFTETYAGKNDPDNFKNHLDEFFSPERLAKELANPNSHFYFVKQENETVAYMKINVEQAQTEPNHHEGLEIERIYVLNAHKGQGIGKLMIDKAIDLGKALKKKYVWLGVWKENPKAISFYHQMGFEKMGTHVYQLGDEAQVDYMMGKDI